MSDQETTEFVDTGDVAVQESQTPEEATFTPTDDQQHLIDEAKKEGLLDGEKEEDLPEAAELEEQAEEEPTETEPVREDPTYVTQQQFDMLMRQQASIQSLLTKQTNQAQQPEPEPTRLLDQLPEEQRNATRQIIEEASEPLRREVEELRQIAAEVKSDKQDIANETYVREQFGDDFEKFSPAMSEIISELKDKVANDPGIDGERAAETIRLYDQYPQALVSDTRARALEKMLAKSAEATQKQRVKNFKMTTKNGGQSPTPEGNILERFKAGKAELSEVENYLREHQG